MSDIVSKSKRSEIMGAIRAKDTKPEVRLRKALFGAGFRYRLHDHRLPGKPDLVFPRYNTVVQVRGCFWHQHSCRDGHIPKSGVRYWKPKLRSNVERDIRNDKALVSLGWNVIVVWECGLRSKEAYSQTVVETIKLIKDGKLS